MSPERANARAAESRGETLHDVTFPEIGGYRVLRKLGEGPRAEVLLGHPAGEAGDAVPAAIKRYRTDVTDESVIGEIEALDRAAGTHVVEIIDVTTGGDGARLLILKRLSGASLARLLADRGSLSPGEAVTVLAPVAATLARAHRAGVSHGTIGPESILFDGAGAPVLARFGRSGLMSPGLPAAALDLDGGVAADRRAFSALVTRVLDRASLAGLTGEPVDLDELSARLFDVAEPLPVDFSHRSGEPTPAVASRLYRADPVGEPGRRAGRSTVRRAGRGSERAIERGAQRPSEPGTEMATGRGTEGESDDGRGAVDGRIAGMLAAVAIPEWADDVARRAGMVGRKVADGLKEVRTRVWVLAAGVLVALMAVSTAGLVVPRASAGSSETDPASPLSSAPDGRPAAPDGSSPPPPGPAEPIVGDDPVAAAVALLAAREQCILDLSILCLDGVAQQSSAALASDSALVRGIRSGGAELPTLLSPGAPTLVERLGDSAIVRLDPDDGAGINTTTSLLLMKGEAGWRIRDYLTG